MAIRTERRQCLQETLQKILVDELSKVLFSNRKIIREQLPKQKGAPSTRRNRMQSTRTVRPRDRCGARGQEHGENPRDRRFAAAHGQHRGWVSGGRGGGRGLGTRKSFLLGLGQSTWSPWHSVAVEFATGPWPATLLGEGRPPPSPARPQRRLDLGVRGPVRPAPSTSAPPLWPRGAHGPDCTVPALLPGTRLHPMPSCPLRPRQSPGRSGEASGLGPRPRTAGSGHGGTVPVTEASRRGLWDFPT